MPFKARYDRNLERLILELKKALAEKKKGPGSEEKTDSLAILRNLIFFVAIYLYFIGWTYSYYLYSHFGVSLYSLDVPFYYFFIYSYSVVFSNGWWFVLAVGIFLTAVFLLRRRKNVSNLVIVLFLLVFFPLTFKMARDTAFESALLLRKGYGQTIKLVFKEMEKQTLKAKPEDKSPPALERQSSSKNYPEEIIKANADGELRLLTQTKDKFFVFFQPEPETEGGELPICQTYILSAADISLATIEAENTPDVNLRYKDIPR